MTLSPNDLRSYFVAGQEGRCKPLTPTMVKVAEESLGYKLPKAFVSLLRVCNGGPLKRCAFELSDAENGAKRVEYFHDVMGICKKCGINGRHGSEYLIEEWGYPELGVVISSEGHTAFMLDYSESGEIGEPRVVLVDVELDEDEPFVDVVAPDFASFLAMLFAPDRDRV